MIADSLGPFSRPVDVNRLPREGEEVTVEATAEERAQLAADLAVPGIDSLTGTFRLDGNASRIRVTGRIEADIRQICVVSLEEFASRMDETVEVEFAADVPVSDPADVNAAEDRPDAIVDGRIDLGSLTAEFVALGLDPYPRKPGVAFANPSEAEQAPASPFSALAGLKPQG